MSENALVTDLGVLELFRDAQDGVFVIDRQRRVTLFSAGCERLLGSHHTLVLGAECVCSRLTDCRDEQNRSVGVPALCPAVKLLRGQDADARQRMSVRHRDGRRVWVETCYSVVEDETGRVSAVVGVMRDITANKQHEDNLRAAAAGGGAGPMGPAGQAVRTAGPTTVNPCPAGGAETPPGSGSLDRILTAIEKREIIAALDRARGSRTVAAQILGVSRSRLYRRMGALGLLPVEEGADGHG